MKTTTTARGGKQSCGVYWRTFKRRGNYLNYASTYRPCVHCGRTMTRNFARHERTYDLFGNIWFLIAFFINQQYNALKRYPSILSPDYFFSSKSLLC